MKTLPPPNAIADTPPQRFSRQLPLRQLSLLPLCLVLFGCPASKPNTTGDATTATSSAKSTIVLRGSNTIGEELAPQLIAAFKKDHPLIAFDVETKATGYGLAALRVGQCDIAAASRPAIEADLELAKDANLEMNDHLLGSYSVAVVVHAGNPVTSLTKAQVQSIFTGKIQNWKDVGGPDAAIHLYIRDPISGTHLGFKDVAMNNEPYALHPKLFTNYTALVTGVAADAQGIGYAGFAMANAAGVKTVTVDGIAATTATVQSEKYPYARALRFYTNKTKESPAVKDFIQFVLSPRGQEIIQQMGFTPKP